MTLYRVQYERTLASAPGVGSWQVYSNGYFDASDPVPNGSDLTSMVALFEMSGVSASIGGTNVFGYSGKYTATGRITIWSVGASFVKLADYAVTPPSFGSGGTVVPSQCCIAIGYRADMGGPIQRGRSRWFVQPGSINGTVANVGGGLRLSSVTAERCAILAKERINDLAADGWTLCVRGVGGVAPAEEVYVDDVFDVQRSRRTWREVQHRRTL